MKLNFFAGVEYKNQIFFSSFSKFNGLFLFDIEREEVRFLKFFEKEELKNQLHRAAFLYKNEAWFIPQEAAYIANINLETMDISYYKIPCNAKKETTQYCSYIKGHVVQNRYLYLIPYHIDTVLIIDMELHKLYPFYEVVNLKEEVMVDGVLVKDNLFLLPAIGSFYIRLNLRTNERERIEWKYGELAFGSIQCIDKKVWLAPILESYILIIDLEDGNKYKLLLPNSEDKYWNMMLVNDDVIFFPYQTANFLIVNKNTLKMQTDVMEKKEKIFLKDPNIVTQIESNEKKIVTMGLKEYVVFFNEEKKVVPLEIDSKCFISQLVEHKKKGICSGELIKREEIFMLANIVGIDENSVYHKLECFFHLDEILNALPYGNVFVNGSKKIGRKIWDRVCEKE